MMCCCFILQLYLSVAFEWRSQILAWLILVMIGIVVYFILALYFFATAGIMSRNYETRSDSNVVALLGFIVLLSNGELKNCYIAVACIIKRSTTVNFTPEITS